MKMLQVKWLAVLLGLGLAGSAMAFDLKGIETAMGTAGTNIGTVATLVLVAVAAVAGVSVIISLIRKV